MYDFYCFGERCFVKCLFFRKFMNKYFVDFQVCEVLVYISFGEYDCDFVVYNLM